MATIGGHTKAEVLEEKDINGLHMVTCRACEACAHAVTVEEAKADLSRTACTTDCENCKALEHSTDTKPAVPLGGTCNDILHICPNDNTRWWQTNTHFHMWQRVTNEREWRSLKNEALRRPINPDYLDSPW